LDRQGEQIDRHQADRCAPEGPGTASVEGINHGAVPSVNTTLTAVLAESHG
jgi:hypothetical protein